MVIELTPPEVRPVEPPVPKVIVVGMAGSAVSTKSASVILGLKVFSPY